MYGYQFPAYSQPARGFQPGMQPFYYGQQPYYQPQMGSFAPFYGVQPNPGMAPYGGSGQLGTGEAAGEE